MRLIADETDGEIEQDPRISKMASDIEGFMVELQEIGCYFKDWNFTIGLVDFPALIEGKEVMLCWKSDEDDIMFYHDFETGFQGRKPIPENYFGE